MKRYNVKPDKTRRFFRKICTLIYLFGSPNLWYTDLQIHPFVFRIHDNFAKATDFLITILILMEWATFFKLEHLEKKQISDLILFSFSQPILFSFVFVLRHYEKNSKYVFRNLAGKLKDVYNCREAEEKMIKKTKFYSTLFGVLTFSALFFYGIDGVVHAIRTGEDQITLLKKGGLTKNLLRPPSHRYCTASITYQHKCSSPFYLGLFREVTNILDSSLKKYAFIHSFYSFFQHVQTNTFTSFFVS